MKKIKKAAVIGAGVMGSTIAAQLANVGIETVLLDIVPPKLTEADIKQGLKEGTKPFRNKLAATGLANAEKSKPAAFYIKDNAKLVRVGNLEDDLKLLADVDWIIEVVVERLDIKQAVFSKLETILKPGIIVTSNTSGIPAKVLCEGRSQTFREHFAITHFFNPPRYLKLLEIVPGPDTKQDVVDLLAHTCERIVGKGIVFAKDTPNFVANRIGAFGLLYVVRAMEKHGLTVEAVDKLTGSVLGHPKSATFRTGDLVGLDTLAHVARNVYDGAPQDEQRNAFEVPAVMAKMIEKNLLGDKSGGGFYKKGKDEKGEKVILSIKPATLEHGPQEKVKLPSLEAAKQADGLRDKLRTLYYAPDKGGAFTFDHLSATLIYAANRIPEIADDIVSIDNAMKWGFGWQLGPFETWDALGVAKSVAKMKEGGFAVPAWVEHFVAAGHKSFYSKSAEGQICFDPASAGSKPIPEKPGIILLPALKDRNKLIAGNAGASLIDLGDGVTCFEFHTKMNSIGDEVVLMMNKACEIVSQQFDGMVIANHGDNFSVGANLALVLMTAQEEEWEDLDYMIGEFQNALMRLKFLDKPVVAAPAGMALGGGCEICMSSDRVRFAAETYMGLVEAGVGLLPAGGGTKEFMIRSIENHFEPSKDGIYPMPVELKPWVSRGFEAIAMAKVATSGPEAIKLGYLRPSDRMTVNRDYLIEDAKKTVLALNLEGYTPPRPRTDIRVGGTTLLAVYKHAIWTMREANWITPHDVAVSNKIAEVLCGGNVHPNTLVSEQYILDLEREAFLWLCGTPETQARMEHMLSTGKPLRN